MIFLWRVTGVGNTSYFSLKTKLTGYFKVKKQEGTEAIYKQGVKKAKTAEGGDLCSAC